MQVRVATCVPQQRWTIAGKLDWLDKALAANPCDLFLLPQEYFGGGSCREICRIKGIVTDDVPVTELWLQGNVAMLARKHKTHLGIGATVRHVDPETFAVKLTEDYIYFDDEGEYLGHHSKIALPKQDSIVTNGASGVTPETDLVKAVTPIHLPKLGIRAGTVFCWQVFFNKFWQSLADRQANLVVHPIKFAPRAWYVKGQNLDGQETRIGFTQNKGSDNFASDELGWIRKLKFESEFKELPIAVSCNSWEGGNEFLALHGFVDEVTDRTKLINISSTAEAADVVVATYDPALYDVPLSKLSLAVYAEFKDVWPALMKGTMRRKAVRIEERAGTARTIAKVAVAQNVEQRKRDQLDIFS